MSQDTPCTLVSHTLQRDMVVALLCVSVCVGVCVVCVCVVCVLCVCCVLFIGGVLRGGVLPLAEFSTGSAGGQDMTGGSQIRLVSGKIPPESDTGVTKAADVRVYRGLRRLQGLQGLQHHQRARDVYPHPDRASGFWPPK